MQNEKGYVITFIDQIKEKTLKYNTLVRQINRLDSAILKIERVF